MYWLLVSMEPWTLENFAGWWVVDGGKEKITSVPGSDSLILNWNRLESLRMDQEWTRNGPGLDLDLDLSLTTTQ